MNENYFILIITLCLPFNIICSSQGNTVDKWADTIGNDLWLLGQRITKFSEIEQRYKLLNAQVETKDPVRLLAEIVENISRMMDRKMDAIQCIINVAENNSLYFEYDNSTTFNYYNSKYSPVNGMPSPKYDLKILNDSLPRYLPMELKNDSHFYNLPVNTEYSSVHVPTNIFDLHEEASIAIQWSQALDDVFIQNYKSDPSLSWQYFGSLSGIMRHYPAKAWDMTKQPDIFDCRIRTWFIEAATCTKDIIIIIDNSGSMDAMGKHIGVLTASNILDTLSNNDYVNVLNYTDRTNYTIECFQNLLVQATEENIGVFKQALNDLKPVNKTNVKNTLEAAFEILAYYRENIRDCDGINKSCNQAIMLITDGISANLSDIVMKYDFLNNGTYKPVRIFSYLVGQEVTNRDEIKWMSCATKGFFTHIQAIEQVTSAVLEYINVIARPLILQGKDHPISWTHAYMDETYDDKTDNQINEPYRLLTSAAGPAFDKRGNLQSNELKANLLGVAATDVPIDDIIKLTLPYKIGVNGYTFIVSNNGYVLMHPDLRPMVGSNTTKNYNSIDLSEVEQLDTNPLLREREIAETLLDLRSDLINGLSGSKHNISIKYHYDHMSRVSQEMYDYYYEPLVNTPFTIVIAIPSLYGNYSLKVGEEIDRNRHTGNKITDFFGGDNWKIHPKWVYCKYHYLEGHEYKTPENELCDFLGKMYDHDFQWKRQYEASVKKEDQNGDIEKEDLEKVECGRTGLGHNDYYCDRQLVERLIFDARNTKASFDIPWDFVDNDKRLFDQYDVTLRFVATMSGFTRWEYKDEQSMKNKKTFGDLHSKAIQENWYKAAVLQHQYDYESFVYSIPEHDSLIMGSYAIFPNDDGKKAPGSVVGFQFSQKKLRQKVREITTKAPNDCPECGTCYSLSCYILDNSGYIVVSVESEAINGRFFGETEPDIMESMVYNNVYKEIIVYDYQALCEASSKMANDASLLEMPLRFLRSKIAWIFEKTSKLAALLDYNRIWRDLFGLDKIPGIPSYACDKYITLYVLQQHFLQSNNFTGEFKSMIYNGTENTREYFVKRIPHSNLIFVAINRTYPKPDVEERTTRAKVIIYDEDFPCYKVHLNNLKRGPVRGCYFKNELENEIKACGKGTRHIQRPTLVYLYIIFTIYSILDIYLN